jgi:hypothetical protein
MLCGFAAQTLNSATAYAVATGPTCGKDAQGLPRAKIIDLVRHLTIAVACLVAVACGRSGFDEHRTPSLEDDAGIKLCADETCPACDGPLDCPSGICTDGVCEPPACTGDECPPTCNDGEKNQDETDVDCGGSVCAGCDIGGACTADGDCLTYSCTSFSCEGVASLSVDNLEGSGQGMTFLGSSDLNSHMGRSVGCGRFSSGNAVPIFGESRANPS